MSGEADWPPGRETLSPRGCAVLVLCSGCPGPVWTSSGCEPGPTCQEPTQRAGEAAVSWVPGLRRMGSSAVCSGSGERPPPPLACLTGWVRRGRQTRVWPVGWPCFLKSSDGGGGGWPRGGQRQTRGRNISCPAHLCNLPIELGGLGRGRLGTMGAHHMLHSVRRVSQSQPPASPGRRL